MNIIVNVAVERHEVDQNMVVSQHHSTLLHPPTPTGPPGGDTLAIERPPPYDFPIFPDVFYQFSNVFLAVFLDSLMVLIPSFLDL